jgi:hypothetical protein
MSTNRWSKRWLTIAGVSAAFILVLYLLWGGTPNGWQGGEICAGLGVLLSAGALIFLRQMETVSIKTVAQRIQKEYPPEVQPQVFEIYQHLKVKELEGLFLKILDDAHGDVNQVRRFANIAESVGWQAFLENKW